MSEPVQLGRLESLLPSRASFAGKYKFAIRYGGEHIPESPVTFSVQDEEEEDGSDAEQQDVRHELRVFGQGLQRAQVESTATFEMEYVDAADANAAAASSPGRRRRPDFPDVEVSRPDGSPLQCSVTRGEHKESMVVRYTPDCVGRHLVALRFPNGHTMDYPIAVSDARAIRLIKGFDRGGTQEKGYIVQHRCI